MLKRLTVHLDKVKKVRVETGYNPKTSKPTSKTILNNTISVHDLTSEVEIKSALSDIRKNHKIAKCKKPNHKTWKVGDEMWYTSNETL